MSYYRYTEKEQIVLDLTRALEAAISDEWRSAAFRATGALENLIRLADKEDMKKAL